MTTYAPEVHVRRPRINAWLAGIVAAGAIVLAAIAGYAIAGGFTSESSTGDEIADGVMNAWATGDEAAIAAVYAPGVKVALIYDELEEVIAADRASLTAAIKGAIAMGNTYEQIGPVATYTTADGDLYVSTLVEVKGAAHPDGDPLVGFYRVRDGKVTRHIFLDAEHY